MFACTHGMHWTRVACLCFGVKGVGVGAHIYLDVTYVKGYFVSGVKKYLLSKKGKFTHAKGPFYARKNEAK